MNIISSHERMTRGTPDFPIELYSVDNKHERYYMQSHWHKEYEIVAVDEGEFDMYLDEKHLHLEAGDSVFIPEGTIHSGKPSQAKYKCVVFPSSVLSATQKSRQFTKKHLTAPITMHSSSAVDSLISVLNGKEEGYECLFISRLYELCYRMAKTAPEAASVPNLRMEKIKTALTYIEEHFSKDITLTELSSECHMSPNYFCRFFKEITHETPMEYVMRYRLEHARVLLKSEVSVTDIAYECGFNDASYFINNFKKHFGMTPNKYRKQSE